MRILIVTSEVTLVEENYNRFLDALFRNYPDKKEIIGLVVLKNNNPSMLLKGMGLILLGAKVSGRNLIKNSILARKKDHEKVASRHQIKTYYFKSANDEQFLKLVNDEKIDLIVNARTRDIYKKRILKAPKIGLINIHHGILPRYRGLMCDLYALSEGREAGFTIHKMESKIDQGGIIKVVTVTKEGESKNFPEHILRSSSIEGIELSIILETIKKDQSIKTTENKTEDIVYTKNPSNQDIKNFIKKGIIL